MMQEDSNGESTFEFVERKLDEVSVSNETLTKTESFSSLSSSASMLGPTGVVSPVQSGGNLISAVSPPSALPSFITSPSVISSSNTRACVSQPAISSGSPAVPSPTPAASLNAPTSKVFIPTPQPTFSPVVPLTTEVNSISPTAVNLTGAGDDCALSRDQGGGGLFGWVKGAMGTGGILSRVAEKAKNSVDTMITTLDPQMKEFLYSGGDVDLVVASDKEVKVSPIREAFQLVFGRATVTGLPAQSTMVAAQPVGFAAGVKAAEERIHVLRKSGQLHEHQPILAVENFLVEIMEERWYDVGVLVLSDPLRGINMQTFTQMTPVPASIVAEVQQKTPTDYPLRWSGLAVTVGSLMGHSLQVHHTEWHQALTGVSRRDMLLLAGKTLAGLYKHSISGR